MKCRILFLLIVLTSSLGQAQNTLRIPLDRTMANDNKGARTTIPILLKSDVSGYLGIPKGDSVFLGHFVFQRGQYWYNEVQKRDSLESYYKKRLSDYKIDTLILSKSKVKCYVAVLSILRGSKKIIIVDTNNNDDFSDENVTEYDTTMMKREYSGVDISFLPTQKVAFDIFKNNQIQHRVAYVKLKPYDDGYKYKTVTQERKAIYVVTFEDLAGSFTINNKKYKVDVDYFIIDGDVRSPTFNFHLEKDETYSKTWVRKNVKYQIEDYQIVIPSYTFYDDTLYAQLTKIDTLTAGWQVGFKIPDILLSNNSLIYQKLKENDFVVLDFWGSWCGPCLIEMPNVAKFYEFTKNRPIALVGVACEYNEKGTIKAQEIIKNKQISWPNTLELLNTENSISTALNVTTFPTSIVIDKQKRIVFRESGIGISDKMREFFEKVK